jgi:hypothetical protein
MKDVGFPAPVLTSSSGSAKGGLMAHLELVSTVVAAMSNPRRSAFPVLRLTPSPRLLLS